MDMKECFKDYQGGMIGILKLRIKSNKIILQKEIIYSQN